MQHQRITARLCDDFKRAFSGVPRGGGEPFTHNTEQHAQS